MYVPIQKTVGDGVYLLPAVAFAMPHRAAALVFDPDRVESDKSAESPAGQVCSAKIPIRFLLFICYTFSSP